MIVWVLQDVGEEKYASLGGDRRDDSGDCRGDGRAEKTADDMRKTLSSIIGVWGRFALVSIEACPSIGPLSMEPLGLAVPHHVGGPCLVCSGSEDQSLASMHLAARLPGSSGSLGCCWSLSSLGSINAWRGCDGLPFSGAVPCLDGPTTPDRWGRRKGHPSPVDDDWSRTLGWRIASRIHPSCSLRIELKIPAEW